MENPFFKEGDRLVYVVKRKFYDLNDADDSYDEEEIVFMCPSWDEAVSAIESKLSSLNLKSEKDFMISGILSKDRNNRFSLFIKIKKPVWYIEDDVEESELYSTYHYMYIEIWNLDTYKSVPYDDEHIFLVDKHFI